MSFIELIQSDSCLLNCAIAGLSVISYKKVIKRAQTLSYNAIGGNIVRSQLQRSDVVCEQLFQLSCCWARPVSDS